MTDGAGATPAPGSRGEGRRLLMSSEELRELDWTAKEEAEKIEIFKDFLYACLDGTEACAVRDIKELRAGRGKRREIWSEDDDSD